MKLGYKSAITWVVALFIQGCASIGLPPAPNVPSRELVDVPFFPQEAYQCGPAALATVLVYAGESVTPETLVPSLYVPDRQGSFQVELKAVTRGYGYLPMALEGGFTNLLAELAAGNPVLVLQNLSFNWWATWHYAVVIGYDTDADQVILRSGTERRMLMSRATFLRTWARSNYWALVITPKDRLAKTASPSAVVAETHGLHSVGQFDAAARYYQRAVERWPNNPTVALAAGNFEYARGHVDAAIDIWLNALPDAKDGVLFNNLASAYLTQGELDKAQQYVDMALERGGRFRDTFVKTADEIACRKKSECE